jgi:hypothetical protein
MLRCFAATLVALALVLPHAAAAADPGVVAVVACDSYADLKKQLRWVGTLVDQPALDGFAESFIMMATQFKGLAGLDVARPAGLVVTAAGDLPTAHAYVPVKDLGKLLDSLVGVVGPVEMVGDVRRIAPPGGLPLDVVEKNGWAIIGPQGSPPPVADPTELLAGVAKQFTLGVQAFPSRMPEGMRKRLQALLDQAAAAAAAQGQQIDRAGVAGMLENLAQAESLVIGAAIDQEGEHVAIESQSRMVPASTVAKMLTDAAQGAVTVATPATSDGKPAALSLHLAMAVPEAARQGAIDSLDGITAQPGSDAGAETAVAILKAALEAMIAAGGYDAALSIDTSVVDANTKKPVPAVTAGMKVKDGAALEARIKKLFAAAGDLPGVKVALDAGKAAGANLHVITLGNAGFPGVEAADDSVDVTLAVAPTYAYLLAGGDVPARLAAVAAASGKPDPVAKPMADLSVAVGPLLRYAASMARMANDGAADPAGLEAAAQVADAQKSALVQLFVRPIESGLSLRLSADAGAIRTVAASVKPKAAPKPAGLPIGPGGGLPMPIPVPVR